MIAADLVKVVLIGKMKSRLTTAIVSWKLQALATFCGRITGNSSVIG